MNTLMAHVGLHEKLKISIWTGFSQTIATKLENIMVNMHKENFA